jgi:hypothetical protein
LFIDEEITMQVTIEHFETELSIEGNYSQPEIDGDGSTIPESFEVTAVITKSGDDITALLDGISDRYAAFLPPHQRSPVGLWGAIADKALEMAKCAQAEKELESVMQVAA